MDKQTREQNNQVSDNAQQKEVATASDLPKEEGKFNQVLSKILGKIKGAWIVVKGKTVIVYNKVCNKVKSIIKNLKEKKNTKQDKKEQAIEKVETPTNAKKVKQKAKKSTEKASIDLKKIFNARNIRIASIVLASVFCLLGAIQVCLFGYGIYNNINYILEIVKQKDIYALLCLAIAVIFILVLIIQITMSILALINKKRKFNLAVLSTLFGTYLACVFFKAELQSEIMIKLGFTTTLLNIGGVVAILFAIICFIGKNVKERLVPIITGLVCCVLGCLVYALEMSNFIAFQVDGVEIAIGNINVYEYITSLINYVQGREITNFGYETMLILACDKSLILFEMVDCSFLLHTLNVIIVLFAKLIPYLAMSILGYYFIVVSTKESRQMKTLKSMGSVGKFLLASICLVLVSAIVLSLVKIELLKTTINYVLLISVVVISFAIIFVARISLRRRARKIRRNIEKLSKA